METESLGQYTLVRDEGEGRRTLSTEKKEM